MSFLESYVSPVAKRGPKPIPWQDRIWRHVSPEPNTGCWLWDGALNNKGYGKIGFGGGNGGTRLVHRLMWEMQRGPIPDDLWVLHRCDVTICCNPEHLFLGTPLDNMQDMHAKGRFVPRGFNATTHCRNGHEFTADNAVIVSGVRRCRICWNAYMREYNARKRELAR